jgi:hypothetical protein
MGAVRRVVQPVPEGVSRIGPGTLKCVVAPGRADGVLAALPERVDTADIRQLGGDAVLVHTSLEAAELRDWLSGYLGAGESLLIVEFEKWSSCGAGVDREWLLARGH